MCACTSAAGLVRDIFLYSICESFPHLHCVCVRLGAPESTQEHFPTVPWSRRSVVVNPQPGWFIVFVSCVSLPASDCGLLAKQWRALP